MLKVDDIEKQAKGGGGGALWGGRNGQVVVVEGWSLGQVLSLEIR